MEPAEQAVAAGERVRQRIRFRRRGRHTAGALQIDQQLPVTLRVPAAVHQAGAAGNREGASVFILIIGKDASRSGARGFPFGHPGRVEAFRRITTGIPEGDAEGGQLSAPVVNDQVIRRPDMFRQRLLLNPLRSRACPGQQKNGQRAGSQGPDRFPFRFIMDTNHPGTVSFLGHSRSHLGTWLQI